MSGEWHVCNPALMPDPLCPGCCAPSQTSTGVDALPADRAASPSAPSRPSGAGSSSSPSVAPADSLPDANGQEPT